ncbi:hypothetical protein [Actinomadura macra]|nr:hypothetical protein [Actinomadura macra]
MRLECVRRTLRDLLCPSPTTPAWHRLHAQEIGLAARDGLAEEAGGLVRA